MGHAGRRIAVGAIAAAIVVIASLPASATYAGTNGDIVYLADGSVRSVADDGSGDQPFTSLDHVVAVSFSLDGTQAVVGQMTAKGARIVLLDLVSDTRSVVLAYHRAPTQEVFSVALSPDSSAVVFCDGFPGRLWTIGTDGSNLTKLPAKGYCYADWGPSGRIVAAKGIFPYDGERVVTTMDADGRNKTVIATFPRAKQTWDVLYVLRPSWAPDGSAVTFPAQRYRIEPDIWLVRSDGSHLHNLTDTDSLSEAGPVFSPDGTKIVFSRSDQSGGKGDLWLMDRDGTNLVQRTDTADGDEYPLAWRPVPA